MAADDDSDYHGEAKPTSVPRPSREEIETLCILHAASLSGCSVDELAVRLGLSRELGSAIAEAIAPLVSGGRLHERDGIVSLTDAGRDWLRVRLTEFGGS